MYIQMYMYMYIPGEDVELKDRDVVVDGEVDGGLQSHGLQGGVDGVHFTQSLSKQPPGYNGSVGRPLQQRGWQVDLCTLYLVYTLHKNTLHTHTRTPSVPAAISTHT